MDDSYCEASTLHVPNDYMTYGGINRPVEMQEIGAVLPDLDGIAAQLRLIRGTEAAAFFYETAPGSVKVSLRSTNYLNVSELAGRFGGGGHVRAGGCTLSGTVEEAKAALVPVLLDALSEGGAPAL